MSAPDTARIRELAEKASQTVLAYGDRKAEVSATVALKLAKEADDADTELSDYLASLPPVTVLALCDAADRRAEAEAVRSKARALREEGNAMHLDSASMSGEAASSVRRAGIARMQRADAMEAGLTASGWACKARPTAIEPEDCNWPYCGCDPAADKVLEALAEQGIDPERIAALEARLAAAEARADRLAEGLREIADRHIQEQPMARNEPYEVWVRRQHYELRKLAAERLSEHAAAKEERR